MANSGPPKSGRSVQHALVSGLSAHILIGNYSFGILSNALVGILQIEGYLRHRHGRRYLVHLVLHKSTGRSIEDHRRSSECTSDFQSNISITTGHTTRETSQAIREETEKEYEKNV